MGFQPENLLERPRPSRVLTAVRKQNRQHLRIMDPGRKMQAAFALSLEARRLTTAGLKAQGFTDAEILSILKESGR